MSRPHSSSTVHTNSSLYLTFEPALTADEIILSSYTEKDLKSEVFPRLHRSIAEENCKAYAQKVAEAERLSAKQEQQRVVVPNYASPFYPSSPPLAALGPPLALTRVTPRATTAPQRAESRSTVIATVQRRMKGVPVNLHAAMGVFSGFMDDRGFLSAAAFTAALAQLQVDDIILADTLFQKLDVHKEGSVRLLVVMLALDGIINGPEKDRVRRACFTHFNLDGRGYIHKAHIDSLKRITRSSTLPPPCTPCMVKALSDVFVVVHREEEEKYVATLLKGKKKKPPPLRPNQKSHIPLNLMRIAHIDYPTFDRFMDKSRDLAFAFAPAWIPLIVADGRLQHLAVVRAIQGSEEEEPISPASPEKAPSPS